MAGALSVGCCELVVEVVKAASLWDDKGASSGDRAFAAVRVEAPASCWLPNTAASARVDASQPSDETTPNPTLPPGGSNPTFLESDAVPSLEERKGEWLFPFSYKGSLVAERGPATCQSLLDKPLHVHVIYAPSGGAKQTVGKVAIDLSTFVTSSDLAQCREIRGTFPVIADTTDAADSATSAGGKGDKNGRRPSSSGKGGAGKAPAGGEKAKGAKTDGAKGAKGAEKAGKDTPSPSEAAPFPGCLPGASLELVISLKSPLMTPLEEENSTVVELDVREVAPVRGKLVEIFQAEPGKDPFTYTLAFGPLPQKTSADIPASSEPDQSGMEAGTTSTTLPTPEPATTSQEPFAVLSGATLAVDPSSGQPMLSFPKPSKRFLSASQAEALKAAIKSGAKWTVEIARYLKDERTDLVDPLFERYRSCAELDLSAFLKPGESLLEARGAFKTPPQERPTSAAGGGKKDEKAAKGAKAGKPPTPSPKEEASSPHEMGTPVRGVLLKPQERGDNKKAKPVDDGKDLPESGGSAWEAVGTVLGVQVRLARPLEAKWEPPPKAEIDLRTLIPDRPRVEPKKDAAQVALENFQTFIQQAIAGLASELGSIPGSEDGHVAQDGHVARRDQLVARLAESGKWFALKEQMKAAVARIADEQSKQPRFDSAGTGEAALYADLYVTLLDEIHSQLNNAAKQTTGSRPETSASVDPSKTRGRLRTWAAEYEASGDAEAAEKLHQDLVFESISGTAGDWYEYGAFCLRTGQPAKAEECLREAISLDRCHVSAHVALACVLWARGQPLKAEALLQGVTGNAEAPLSDAVAAWTLLALLYAELPNRPKDVRNCLLEAARLNDSRGQVSGESAPCLYLQAARLVLDYHLPELAEKALEEQRKTEGAEWGLEEKLCAARGKKLRGNLGGAAEILEGLLGEGVKVPRVAVELGHVRYAAAQFETAAEAYQTARDHAGQLPLDLTVYLNLGSLHLSRGSFTEAKDVYLEACHHHPGAATWLGAGAAFLGLGDLARAEQALAEANSLNPRHPAVWAHLALVCLRGRGREEEAAFALREALRNDVRDAAVLTEVGERCLGSELYRYAEAALRRAVQNGASVQARRLLAEALLRQQHVKAAQQELEAILQLPDLSPEEKASVDEQLHGL